MCVEVVEINLCSDILNVVGIIFDEIIMCENVMQFFNVLLGDNYGLDIDMLDKDVVYDSCFIQFVMLCDDEIFIYLVFNCYYSEIEMMCYMYLLECKDLVLNQVMILLGFCIMKLNVVVEMILIIWLEFVELYLFCLLEQVEGYQQMIVQLVDWLVKLIGYDVVCMQLNFGVQGEYVGLLVICYYYESCNEGYCDICLILVFVYGINFVFVYMVGMQVVVVVCDKNGNIDLIDLCVKVEQVGDNFFCIMVIYFFIYGVYEEMICEVCEVVYQFGGQVYFDGVNMNVQVGIILLGFIGVDVLYFNLYKIFCILYGGGGLGMGLIGVKVYLVLFVLGYSVV